MNSPLLGQNVYGTSSISGLLGQAPTGGLLGPSGAAAMTAAEINAQMARMYAHMNAEQAAASAAARQALSAPSMESRFRAGYSDATEGTDIISGEELHWRYQQLVGSAVSAQVRPQYYGTIGASVADKEQERKTLWAKLVEAFK